jgi:hypothetical protein
MDKKIRKTPGGKLESRAHDGITVTVADLIHSGKITVLRAACVPCAGSSDNGGQSTVSRVLSGRSKRAQPACVPDVLIARRVQSRFGCCRLCCSGGPAANPQAGDARVIRHGSIGGEKLDD